MSVASVRFFAHGLAAIESYVCQRLPKHGLLAASDSEVGCDNCPQGKGARRGALLFLDSLDGDVRVRVGDRPAGLLGRDEADRLRGLRFGGLSRRGL